MISKPYITARVTAGVSSKHRSWLIFLVILVIMIIMDQIAKRAIIAYFADHTQPIDITSFFRLVLAHNYGVSFGLFSNESPYTRWALVALATILTTVIIIWFARQPRLLYAIAFGLIAAGALGNLIDRVLYGFVIDFFHFYWQNYHFPVFNIADSCITIGALFLVYDAVTHRPAKIEEN